MTPEELATKLAVEFVADHKERGGDGWSIMSEGAYRYAILTAIREAVAEMQERCAKVAEEVGTGPFCGESVADAIRALK